MRSVGQSVIMGIMRFLHGYGLPINTDYLSVCYGCGC